MRLCQTSGCSKKLYAKGDCVKHYQKARKTREVATKYKTPEEAFAARTEWQGECLVWNGSKGQGYGTFIVKGKVVRTHRYAYERVHGAIPKGLLIDHMCYNRA